MCESSLGTVVCGSDQRLKLGFRTAFSWIEQYQNQVTRKQPTVARCRPRQHGRLLELWQGLVPPVPAIGVLHRQEMPNVSNAKQKHFGRGPLIQPTTVKHLYNDIRWWQPVVKNHRRAGTGAKNKQRVPRQHALALIFWAPSCGGGGGGCQMKINQNTRQSTNSDMTFSRFVIFIASRFA